MQKLESQEADEGASVTLRCELSKPGVPVEWKKGTETLKSGEKYQMKQKACVNELLINKVEPEDSGDYSCVCGDQKTSASIKINGRWIYDLKLYGILIKLCLCDNPLIPLSVDLTREMLCLILTETLVISHLLLLWNICLISVCLLAKCQHALWVSDIRFLPKSWISLPGFSITFLFPSILTMLLMLPCATSPKISPVLFGLYRS